MNGSRLFDVYSFCNTSFQWCHRAHSSFWIAKVMIDLSLVKITIVLLCELLFYWCGKRIILKVNLVIERGGDDFELCVIFI